MTENKKEKIDKYITDMKELPPNAPSVSEKETQLEEKILEKVKPSIKPAKPVVPKRETPSPISDLAEDRGIKSLQAIETSLIYTSRDIILGVINLVTIVFLVYLLTRLPQKSLELKAERITEAKTAANFTPRLNTLNEELEMSKKIESLFLDESGVVSFVRDIDKLKGPTSGIQKVTFTSQIPIKDKLSFFGIPTVIEISGSWNQISTDLEKIESLPYFFRPVSVKILPSKENPTVTEVEYGGILYVNDKVAKTKPLNQ